MFSTGIFLISSELWIKAAQRINCKQPLDCLPWQRNYKFKPLVNKVTVISFSIAFLFLSDYDKAKQCFPFSIAFLFLSDYDKAKQCFHQML